MLKRYFSVLLILLMTNFLYMPAIAKEDHIANNIIIDTAFKTEFNVNKASKGEVVQFISTEDYENEGISIPRGTIFEGEITHFKKGRWAYRRAKAVIKINNMILPDGEIKAIQGETKRHVLKGSALANTGKGIITFPIAIVVGACGAAVIIVETVSIVGLLIVGPTSYLVGRTMGSLTHGINYKKHEGDEIQLRIKKI